MFIPWGCSSFLGGICPSMCCLSATPLSPFIGCVLGQRTSKECSVTTGNSCYYAFLFAVIFGVSMTEDDTIYMCNSAETFTGASVQFVAVLFLALWIKCNLVGILTKTAFLCYSQASPDLADTINQMLTKHGPLVKVRPSAAVVGIPFKRQGSLDGGQLPNVLAGQVQWELLPLSYPQS